MKISLVQSLSLVYLILSNCALAFRYNGRIRADPYKMAQRMSSLTAQVPEGKISFQSLQLPSSSSIQSIPLHMVNFIDQLKLAIDTKQPDKILQLLNQDATWSNPVVRSQVELEQNLKLFFNFFQEPTFQIFQISPSSTATPNHESFQITYQLSFHYPLPWQPRIIIPSTLQVTFDPVTKKVKSVIENWEVSIQDIFFKQVPPRFWDVFHSFPTPVPEYPSIKILSKLKSINIIELPQTIIYECTWKGLAKYPGPPLTILPDFVFQSSELQGKKKYYTSLPVEVQSGKFMNATNSSKMKFSRWRCHVPTTVQNQVLTNVRLDEKIHLEAQSLLDNKWKVEKGEDDDELEITNQTLDTNDRPIEGEEDDGTEELEKKLEKLTTVINSENLSVMDSLKGGALRGDYILDVEYAKEYESNQEVYAKFKRIPKRIIASVEIPGEVTAEKVSQYYKTLTETLRETTVQVGNKRYEVQKRLSSEESDDEPLPDFSLLLNEVRSCWNVKGELGMAYYDTHFNLARTKLFVELSPI